MVDPLLIVLPVINSTDAEGPEKFKVLSADGLAECGYRYASAWFFDAEQRWENTKTDKNREMATSLTAYLDWQSKLSEQNPRAQYLVLYTSSATDASAAVIDRRDFDHPFVVDHKTYWCACTSEPEAHYLCAYINSGYANEKIKDFQSRGLFGPRDIHKLVVKLPFPRYQRSETLHAELAQVGHQCARLAQNFVRAVNVEDLQARALGTVRARLKDQLSAELDRIDDIVATLSEGRVAPERQKRRRSRRGNASARLFD
jgi:hypothetical protein